MLSTSVMMIKIKLKQFMSNSGKLVYDLDLYEVFKDPCTKKTYRTKITNMILTKAELKKLRDKINKEIN